MAMIVLYMNLRKQSPEYDLCLYPLRIGGKEEAKQQYDQAILSAGRCLGEPALQQH